MEPCSTAHNDTRQPRVCPHDRAGPFQSKDPAQTCSIEGPKEEPASLSVSSELRNSCQAVADLQGQRPSCATLRARRASFRRHRKPRTTCLYSAASILVRRPSAIFNSSASKPTLAPVSAFDAVFPLGGIGRANSPHVQAKIHPRYWGEEFAFQTAKAPRLSADRRASFFKREVHYL